MRAYAWRCTIICGTQTDRGHCALPFFNSCFFFQKTETFYYGCLLFVARRTKPLGRNYCMKVGLFLCRTPHLNVFFLKINDALYGPLWSIRKYPRFMFIDWRVYMRLLIWWINCLELNARASYSANKYMQFLVWNCFWVYSINQNISNIKKAFFAFSYKTSKIIWNFDWATWISILC